MKMLFSFHLLLFIVAFLVLAEASISFDSADSLTHMDGNDDQVSLYRKYGARKINCSYECARRCRKASRKKICHRACKTCCARCHCVPPGTYGNKSVCPCYARLTTHGNKPKCP